MIESGGPIQIPRGAVHSYIVVVVVDRWNRMHCAVALKRCLTALYLLGVQGKDVTYVATVVGYLQRAVCG